ncbi:hypothetical protein [Salinicola sp. MIT1003]|uniref:hypothetical protein n=1 Tax=Salinicola sp. MIT1003 TaxID=1882734 RepID=UPI0008DCF2B6|nr:hypothetical protein [Salinicola sp. MIT1003]OHZ02991.1 hypothetical protein BC443_14980 [Salinicola sp. MIT1003]
MGTRIKNMKAGFSIAKSNAKQKFKKNINVRLWHWSSKLRGILIVYALLFLVAHVASVFVGDMKWMQITFNALLINSLVLIVVFFGTWLFNFGNAVGHGVAFVGKKIKGDK